MKAVNVLFVDDEVAFAETMSKRLTKRGFDVRVVHDGQACLDDLQKHGDVEVVILDVKMPGMDGLETLKLIKADHPLIEVIMLTGHATVESAIEGMKRGSFDYLMKPCEIEDLVSKVEEAAQRKRGHEEKIIQAQIRDITSRRP
ncbi:MAG: response regulator [Planctomycetota bacterium]